MNPQRNRLFGATLAELLVAFGLLSLVMTAVMSFYIEASAVTAKRTKISDRLRRFHLGLDKMEQILREGRVIHLSSFEITLFHLTDISELDGFPDFSPYPMQFVSKKDGVYQVFGQENRNILPFEPGERLIFQWLPFDGDKAELPNTHLVELALYYSGGEDSRSDLLFRRQITLEVYYGRAVDSEY